METLLGRRRVLSDLKLSLGCQKMRARRARAERCAFNTLIQGSASDVFKMAIVNVEKVLNQFTFKHTDDL